jgi:hypothetical protein
VCVCVCVCVQSGFLFVNLFVDLNSLNAEKVCLLSEFTISARSICLQFLCVFVLLQMTKRMRRHMALALMGLRSTPVGTVKAGTLCTAATMKRLAQAAKEVLEEVCTVQAACTARTKRRTISVWA